MRNSICNALVISVLTAGCLSEPNNTAKPQAMKTSYVDNERWASSETRIFEKDNLKIALVDLVHEGDTDYYTEIANVIRKFISDNEDSHRVSAESNVHFLLEQINCKSHFKLADWKSISLPPINNQAYQEYTQNPFNPELGNAVWQEYFDGIVELNQYPSDSYYNAQSTACHSFKVQVVNTSYQKDVYKEKAIYAQYDISSPFNLLIEAIKTANCRGISGECLESDAVKFTFADLTLGPNPGPGWESYFATGLYGLVKGKYPDGLDSILEEFLWYINRSNLGLRNQKVIAKIQEEYQLAVKNPDQTRKVIIPWGLDHNYYFRDWLLNQGFQEAEVKTMKAYPCNQLSNLPYNLQSAWKDSCKL